MKRIFLSLPMSGKTDIEIEAQIEEMKAEFLLKNPFDDGEEIVFADNLRCSIWKDDEEEARTPSLLYLGEAIRKLAYCDGVYFGEGWTTAKGCMIEMEVCEKYGISRFVMLPDGTIYCGDK